MITECKRTIQTSVTRIPQAVENSSVTDVIVRKYPSRTQAEEQAINNYCKAAVYYFYSTSSSGTEGIRGLENFVALFAPYRVFFMYPKFLAFLSVDTNRQDLVLACGKLRALRVEAALLYIKG